LGITIKVELIQKGTAQIYRPTKEGTGAWLEDSEKEKVPRL